MSNNFSIAPAHCTIPFFCPKKLGGCLFKGRLVILNFEQVLTELHKDYVFIKTEYRLEKIMLNEVLYLEGMKDYIKIVTTDKQIMTLMNFKEITEIFNNPNFFRVHHSFIVAVDKIDFIERNRVVIKEKYIPISESKRENFFKMIGKQ